jgi:carboxylate-amine ligase
MTTFGPGGHFTIGIEEELLVVDPVTLALSPRAAEIMSRLEMPRSDVDHEAYAAQLELRSTPSTSALEAVELLRAARSAVVDTGVALIGAGVHPDGSWGDAALVEDDRYAQVYETVRGLIRRTPESALHVHVGMPDADSAVRVHNGLRPYLPLLQGLSANSPWWFGVDSGFASARYALVQGYPGRGIPQPLSDLEEWERRIDLLTRTAGLKDYTYLWLDLRLHPRLGTVEVREMDAQSSLERVAALTALVRALAREAIDAPTASHLPSEAVSWSSFRAARDGLDASILWKEVLTPLRELARATVERLRPVAAELGDEEALLAVMDIVAEGEGAALQRRAYSAGGTGAVLRALVDDTCRGVTNNPRTGDLPKAGLAATTNSAEEVVRAWLEARGQGDLRRLAELTATCATWDSPVEGRHVGRDAVVEKVEAAFAETDTFFTDLLSLQVRGDKGVAVIRNTGRRGDANLDSLQTLFLTVNASEIRSVRIAVDDPAAVEEFWAG